MRSQYKEETMEISFECEKCKGIFDSDVSVIKMNDKTFRPDFEKPIICPKCGVRTIDEVLLTELGQSQLTKEMMDS
jgi:Zn finger protein HypA/HybF involved in hydrogenase expression